MAVPTRWVAALTLLLLPGAATARRQGGSAAAPGCIDIAGQYTDPFGNGVAVAQHGCEVVATYTPAQPFSPATGRAFATDVVLLYPTIGNLSATVQPDSAALKWSNGVLWRKDGPLPKMPTIWLPTAGPVRCVDVAERTTQCLGIQFGTAERWQRPKLATWTEPRDALVYGPQCAQQGCAATNGSTLLPGCSEECLFLNVFAPRQGLHPPGTKHPVVVWIHGGGYELYSSHGLNGTTRVEASGGDLVWVTIEYRLAAFGFLGHEQMRKLDRPGSVGNYGLQDQRLALEWVQKNIAAFGGDPENVMIDGCSAGAGSTANHAVNEHSWPFFAKAAGESGMFAMWNSNTLATAESVFEQLSNFTGCGDAHDNTVSCLQGKNAADIIRASALLPGLMLNIPRIDKIVWAPVIDGVDTIDHPYALAKAGHHYKGPLLLGTARDEGTSFNWLSAGDCPSGSLPCPVPVPGNFSRSEFEEWAPQAMPGVTLEKILNLYSGHPQTESGAGVVHSEWYWAAAKLTGDVGFHCGSRMGARWLSGEQPVFLYSWAPAIAFGKIGQDLIGHCTENPSIYMDDSGPDYVGEPLTAAIGAYWYSFAKHGDPNIARSAGSPVWEQYSNTTDSNLVFDEPIRTERGLRKAQCELCATTTMCEGRNAAFLGVAAGARATDVTAEPPTFLHELVSQMDPQRPGNVALFVPAPGNIYATPLRFKLGGRRIMSARFNVETAGSERKRPEI